MARTVPVCTLIAAIILTAGCTADLDAEAPADAIPWTADDLSPAGPPGEAQMCRPAEITPGEVFTYVVTGADPGTRVWFMRGNSEEADGACPGGVDTCFDLDVARLLGVAWTEDGGDARLTLVAPPEVPIGANVAVQAVFYQDGEYVMSNVTNTLVSDVPLDIACGSDVCGADDASRACACGAGDAPGEDFDNGMYGCATVVTYPDRADACGEGFHVCTAMEWLDNRGDIEPLHHYWTDDQLGYSGLPEECSVGLEDEHGFCDADEPMRVCALGPAFDNFDPLGNECNWSGCGYEDASVNDYFGGCLRNPTAGVLCCAD